MILSPHIKTTGKWHNQIDFHLIIHHLPNTHSSVIENVIECFLILIHSNEHEVWQIHHDYTSQPRAIATIFLGTLPSMW